MTIAVGFICFMFGFIFVLTQDFMVVVNDDEGTLYVKYKKKLYKLEPHKMTET